MGLVRAIAPFVAGSSGLRYRRFMPFSIIGCGLWATLFSVLGYIFYRSFDRVASIAGKATLAFGITVAPLAAAVFVWRRLRDPEDAGGSRHGSSTQQKARCCARWRGARAVWSRGLPLAAVPRAPGQVSPDG